MARSAATVTPPTETVAMRVSKPIAPRPECDALTGSPNMTYPVGTDARTLPVPSSAPFAISAGELLGDGDAPCCAPPDPPVAECLPLAGDAPAAVMLALGMLDG